MSLHMVPLPRELDPDGDGPEVAGAAGTCPEDLREPLARYLLDSSVLMAAPMRLDDPVDPSRERVVAIDIHTDGGWCWATAWGYLVREHGVAVPPELLEHARSRGFIPSSLSDAEMMALVED